MRKSVLCGVATAVVVVGVGGAAVASAGGQTGREDVDLPVPSIAPVETPAPGGGTGQRTIGPWDFPPGWDEVSPSLKDPCASQECVYIDE